MLTLAHLGAGCPRALQENRVEHRAPEREPAIAEGAEAVRGGELAANARAVRRTNHHPREMRGARGLARLERAHGAQNPRCLRTKIFRARLLARKYRAIEHHHVRALAREMPRSRAAGGARADDEHVDVAAINHHEKERLSR